MMKWCDGNPRFEFLPEDRPTRVYLLRHGEVTTFERRTFNGQTDVGLTPRGLLQLEEVAARLASCPIRAVYTSDLQRSVRGGEAIAKACGVSLFQMSELREKDFGRWEGLTAEEISGQDPDGWSAWLTNPADSRPGGEESYREVGERALAAFKIILRKHAGEEVAVVAHGGVNKVLLADALGQSPTALFRIEQKYAALNIIDYFKNRAVVKLING
ncbi:MAG: histidine phosphatase family protein [Candidatus Manganitrophus sp.]|nr:histidine phosphatase family protein [Candidatus Manganitrophus sp.]WDT72909.1 MAG: histidine phosphatase family protein [Candidatus Manganitrophus sp.]WDT79577.1 MAG: histidine phosphatase family protein [Candidatus Manganitrophus sp.]